MTQDTHKYFIQCIVYYLRGKLESEQEAKNAE